MDYVTLAHHLAGGRRCQVAMVDGKPYISLHDLSAFLDKLKDSGVAIEGGVIPEPEAKPEDEE